MPPKKEIGFIKLQIPAGQANPAPPVGPAFCLLYTSDAADE